MDENIVSLLKRHRRGLSYSQLASWFRLRGKEKTRLRRQLKALQGQGVLLKKRHKYIVLPEKTVLQGVFLAGGKGYAFVTPQGQGDGGEDIFIPGRYTRGAVSGDLVEVTYTKKGKKGKPEGKVLRILSRGSPSVLGIFEERAAQPFVIPFDTATAEALPVRDPGSLRPKPGMVVEIKRENSALTKILGWPDDPGVDTEVIIRRFNLAVDFSPDALTEAASISSRIQAPERAGRKDFRSWPTVTIDGENAQDFDDAVSIRELRSGHFLLGVHIADVSHYVRPGTSLDREAFERGTSVYFPDLTLPMLPERLSNDLCSLRPRKTRLTVSVLLEIDRQGRVVQADFTPSLIRTVERLTYTSVFKIFQGDEEETKRYAPLVPDLFRMRELAAILRSRREEEGSLNFDLLEPELVYREGRLHSVVAFEANEAHHLIEEFMVAANVAVARALSERSQPAIFRVHPPPGQADLEELRDILGHFGLYLPPPDRVTSADLQRVLKKVEGRPEEKFVDTQVLRALRLAAYSADNTGHYGLAKKEYTHFTSPIRRYPDLVVHRGLKALLQGKKMVISELASLALHCSRRERLADEAERALVEWRIYRLLRQKLGQEVEGMIVDFTTAGLIVELEDYFVDGLIPYRELDGDYYRRRSKSTLTGRRSGRLFRLGEKVKVTLTSVDPIGRRIGLALLHGQEGKG